MRMYRQFEVAFNICLLLSQESCNNVAKNGPMDLREEAVGVLAAGVNILGREDQLE